MTIRIMANEHDKDIFDINSQKQEKITRQLREAIEEGAIKAMK